MADLAFSITVGDITVSSSITSYSELFQHPSAKVAAGASDVSLSLGTLTHPKLIFVAGPTGVSFKLTGGTDVIPAFPGTLITDEDGFANASILLSNSGGAEATVQIVACE